MQAKTTVVMELLLLESKLRTSMSLTDLDLLYHNAINRGSDWPLIKLQPLKIGTLEHSLIAADCFHV